jgi:hypothetical protein
MADLLAGALQSVAATPGSIQLLGAAIVLVAITIGQRRTDVG